MYANVRPCASLYPYVATKHPRMDIVIVRENEERRLRRHRAPSDQPGGAVSQADLPPGSERIVRYAFEYARVNKRKKVTCFTKDNIMKFTDGLFHRTFNEIAPEYPEIEHEHWIVDIGAAKMADTPEAFDVLVMPKSLRRRSLGRRRSNHRFRGARRVRRTSAITVRCSKRSTAPHRVAPARTSPTRRACCTAPS